MGGPERLEQSEDRWTTGMGAFFPEEGRVVFRGKDLHRDCKDMAWMELLLYGITGRRFDANQTRLFEGIWTLCTSYPDPRLWNNRVAALAGTVRSTASLAVCGANAVSEATIYGHRPIIGAIDFLLAAKTARDLGGNLAEFVKDRLRRNRTLPGYGRPVRRTDERIGPVLALLGELGFPRGPHVALAFEIEDILLAHRFRLPMNIAALLAAIAADQGLSRREYHHFMILGFSAGMFPCYIEAVNQPGLGFFPLRCDRIAYEGTPARPWHTPAAGEPGQSP